MATNGHGTIRAQVIRSKCSGYGICADLCPEVFVLDEQGFATVADGPVPAALEAHVREAAYECPEEAIQILESPLSSGATAGDAQPLGGPHAAGRDLS